jgi:hypothetical protein
MRLSLMHPTDTAVVLMYFATILKRRNGLFILQRCFAQHLLEVRDEVLLTAVTQVIGHCRPVGLVGLADQFSRCKELVTLQQPFEPNADIVPKELLQPAFAPTKRVSDSGHGLQVFICFDGRDDLVEMLNVRVGLRVLRPKLCYEMIDDSGVVQC